MLPKSEKRDLPTITYLTKSQNLDLTKLSRATHRSKAQVLRDALDLATIEAYNAGIIKKSRPRRKAQRKVRTQ